MLLKTRERFGFSNRGTALLLLLVLLAAVGLAASRLIPSEITVNQRRSEADLKHDLGSLRMAVALERMASLTPLFHADWSSRTQFLNYLNELTNKNFLSTIPRDPLVPQFQWGTGTGKIFWIPTRNYLASSSFEVVKLGDSPWATGSQNVLATVTSTYWTGQNDPDFDSYRNENRFGALFQSSGTCLLISKP